MARRKQPRPTRPQRPQEEKAPEDLGRAGEDEDGDLPPSKRPRRALSPETKEGIWRDVILPDVGVENGIEVAEINLEGISREAGSDDIIESEKCSDHAALRVRVRLPIGGNAKGWGLPEISRQEWRLQLVECGKQEVADSQDCQPSESDQNADFCKVIASGEVDGPDSALSALAYLTSRGFTTLRPAPCLSCGSPCCRSHEPSSRLRVLISKLALTSSDEVYSYQRPTWMKAMQTLITWLRPEVVSETRSRGTSVSSLYHEEIRENFETLNAGGVAGKQPMFDPSALYDAIKPSNIEPGLEMNFPELRPDLRPYQRRAAYWMVQRERGLGAIMGSDRHSSRPALQSSYDEQRPSTSAQFSTTTSYPDQHPLWLPIVSLDGFSTLFFNPNTGAVSLAPHEFVSYVKGGILADEMGLGKTVELLACILSNPFKSVSGPSAAEEAKKLLCAKLASRKCERVECACGALEEVEDFAGSWVQCDMCDAWQHAACVGYGNSAALKRLSSTAELIGSMEVRGDCSATLVVCPAPILEQWQDEILRHTRAGSLRVIVYEGVEKGAFFVMGGKDTAAEDKERLTVVSAHDLAAADIVLTTYDTLRADLSHDSDKSLKNDRSLRYVKRYRVVPTPLTRLSWWRVCLDEAQMVESKSRATEMALLLDAQNRWCVTGTPIQRGLDDLFGLLRFIDAQPFDDYRNWNQALRQPYEAGDAQAINYMHKFLRVIMWRSSKEQVKDELGLPPQKESLSWLRFSPVEAHFYRQQHEKCALKARAVISKYGRKPKQSRESRALPQSAATQVGGTNSNGALEDQMPVVDNGGRTDVELDRDESATQRNANTGAVIQELGTENQTRNDLARTAVSSGDRFSYFDGDRPLSEASILAFSLLRLRQACCHPQVGSAGIRSLQQQTPMTMDEILQVLVDKAKIEAEEAQRALIGALNGLAALAVIESDVPFAVSIYREALSITEESAADADVDVDPLQKLHTLHNLAEILGMTPSPLNGEQISSNGRHDTQTGLQLSKAPPGTSAEMELTRADIIDKGSKISQATSAPRTVTGKQDSPSEGINNGRFADGLGDASGKDLNRVKVTGLHLQGSEDQGHSVASVRLLGGKIPRTLRDDVLVKQCQEIRSKYMASFHAKLANEQAEFESASVQVSEAKKASEEYGGQGWWLQVVSLVSKKGRTEEKDFLFKIQNHLLKNDNLGKHGRHRNASSLAFLFREVSGLKLVVQRELDALGSAHDNVTKSLKILMKSMENPTAQDVERIVLCPRHSENLTGTLCAHCEIDDLFQAYENRLFLLRTSAAEAGGLVSAEDAVIAQHRILALRRISGLEDDQRVTGRNPYSGGSTELGRSKRGTTATEAEVLRAPSEIEQVLSIIKSFAKKDPSLQKAATRHLHMFEALKKEYSQMRALTKIQRELLYALDELNMATTRLSLQLPGEKVESEIEMLVKLSAEEVPQRNVELTSEKFDALNDFSRTKGQLRYLKGLSLATRQQYRNSRVKGSTRSHPASQEDIGSATGGWGRIEEEACPVCQEKIGSQLMVLPCGHLLCCKCCMVMIDRTPIPVGGVSQKRITCPNCRRRTHVGDIAFVDNGSDRNIIAEKMGQVSERGRADEEASIQVNGSYGTKIGAVVRRLLWLKSQDRDNKVIIFSTWTDVLNVVEHALVANMITYARVKGSKLDAAVRRFRGLSSKSLKVSRKRGPAVNKDEHIQVLLLPMIKGGNGLNLVEAQHVILVEPLPNPALEAQAINRIHRIGQTRATFVHRFIVRDTVEESIYWLGRKNEKVFERFPGHGLGRFGKGGQYTFTLNDVSALFESNPEAGNTTGEVNSSSTAQQSIPAGLTPAAAAAAAAVARLGL